MRAVMDEVCQLDKHSKTHLADPGSGGHTRASRLVSAYYSVGNNCRAARSRAPATGCVALVSTAALPDAATRLRNLKRIRRRRRNRRSRCGTGEAARHGRQAARATRLGIDRLHGVGRREMDYRRPDCEAMSQAMRAGTAPEAFFAKGRLCILAAYVLNELADESRRCSRGRCSRGYAGRGVILSNRSTGAVSHVAVGRRRYVSAEAATKSGGSRRCSGARLSTKPPDRSRGDQARIAFPRVIDQGAPAPADWRGRHSKIVHARTASFATSPTRTPMPCHARTQAHGRGRRGWRDSWRGGRGFSSFQSDAFGDVWPDGRKGQAVFFFPRTGAACARGGIHTADRSTRRRGPLGQIASVSGVAWCADELGARVVAFHAI